MNEIAGMLVSALGQGFIYAPMALGVFLTFSILKTPDLTVEGSFVFGMTACVVVTIAGHPILGLVAGTLAGAAAGFCTGLLQTKLKIEPILSGILTMTGLYTVNYAILGGQSNRYLQYEAKNSLGVTVNKPADTVYKIFQRAFGKDMSSGMTAFLLTMIIVIVTCAVLVTFFRTRNGMAIIATGDNEEMVRSSSINADVSRIGGVMISNALVAFSGALLCQYQKYADLNCGNGMLVMGLASVLDLVKEFMTDKNKMKDLYQKVFPSNDYIESGKIEKIHMDTGKVDVKIQIRDSYYYDILSDLTGLPIKSEYHLIRLMKELSAKKKEFEEVSQALKDARERGYGVMKPVLSEITLSEPEVVKHGNKYGVKIRAEAPSIHLIRANLTTEVAPIVGTQLQAEDLITYIKEQAGEEPREIWNVNIFGKTLEQLVDDGISGKVTKINDDSQEKLQNAMEKIVNESSGGLICIII